MFRSIKSMFSSISGFRQNWMFNKIYQFFAIDARTNIFVGIINDYITFILEIAFFKEKSGRSH